MKKLSALSTILATLILAAALVSCSSEQSEAPYGMKLITDENEVVNYNLYVPESWTASISTGAVGAYCSNTDTTNVTVMAWNVSADETVDTWWDKYRADFDLVFDEFTLTSEESTTLGGVAAKKYTYTAKLGDNEFNFVQCACIHWSMVYIMTFTSSPDNFASHAEDFSDIITNFEFH